MYEESNGRVFNGGILSLILKLLLLAIFVFILCWLFTRTGTSRVIKETGSSYANNIATMKEAAFEYFTTDKLPHNIGGTEKLSLSQMLNQKLLIDFTDDGKACDNDASYVQATKTADENYALKVSLTCNKQSDFIVTTIEKKDVNVTVDCATCHQNDLNNNNNNGNNNQGTVVDDNDVDDKNLNYGNNNPSSNGSTNKATNTNKNTNVTNNNTTKNTTSSNKSSTTNVTNNYTYVTTTVTTSIKVSYSCTTCKADKSTVLVKYVDEAGKEIASSTTLTGKVGSSYTTYAKGIDGYILKTTPLNASGFFTKEGITVTYVYTKVAAQDSIVIARYVDEAGREIANAEVITGKVGNTYTTNAKSINGYSLKTVPSNANGVFANDTITVTYVYAKVVTQGSVTARYVDTNGNVIASDVTSSCTVGGTYTTSAKNISGYKLKATPSDATGKCEANGRTVTYIYERLTQYITYYKLVKYGAWRTGNVSGDGYETSCSNETVYDYCKKSTKHYWSTSYVSQDGRSNYSYTYTIKFEDFTANQVVDGSVSIANRNYFQNLNDYYSYLDYNNNKPISMVNGDERYAAGLTDVISFRNGSLTSNNFSYRIGDAYKMGNYYYVDITITIHNKNITPYYSQRLNKYVYLVPVKFDLLYTPKNGTNCITDTAANASYYPGYEKTNPRTTRTCKYREVTYRWVKETELQSYLNSGWKKTGETKIEPIY